LCFIGVELGKGSILVRANSYEKGIAICNMDG
jgi:hypothetical protein